MKGLDVELITIDFETYYDRDYSLSKLPTDEYVSSIQFQIIGVGIKRGSEPSVWHPNTSDNLAVQAALSGIDWSDAAVICHNTLFDGYILTYHFGVRPKLWMDTLSMSRMLYPYLSSHSLAALSKLFGLPEKGTFVQNALGRRLESFNTAELNQYGEYCQRQVERKNHV